VFYRLTILSLLAAIFSLKLPAQAETCVPIPLVGGQGNTVTKSVSVPEVEGLGKTYTASVVGCR
jgi:hypothetical protein